MALTDKLTAIGNAIRNKTGGTELLTLDAMPTEIEGIKTGGTVEALDITANGTYTAPEGVDGYSPITVNVPQDGSPPDEAFVISGDCSYRFAFNGWNWFLKTYKNQIITQDISTATYIFFAATNLEEIPIQLNFNGSRNRIERMFGNCYSLRTIPKINNCQPNAMDYLFYGCYRLRNLPEGIESYFDWSYIDSLSIQYGYAQNNMFTDCKSLRSIPMGFLNHGSKNTAYSQCIYYSAFNGCYVLDEIVGLPFPHKDAKWTSNTFSSTFNHCYRLKNMTFALSDGQPYVMQWKSQTIDLTGKGIVAGRVNDIISYNSGITADKEVKDDATYQALKDDPDWFTTMIVYSRYNHDSAVATINSLPDTSAYLATAGGTNTIKFTGASGRDTDGGAINTLTEEEIAVAAAKGWTVTLS